MRKKNFYLLCGALVLTTACGAFDESPETLAAEANQNAEDTRNNLTTDDWQRYDDDTCDTIKDSTYLAIVMLAEPHEVCVNEAVAPLRVRDGMIDLGDGCTTTSHEYADNHCTLCAAMECEDDATHSVINFDLTSEDGMASGLFTIDFYDKLNNVDYTPCYYHVSLRVGSDI